MRAINPADAFDNGTGQHARLIEHFQPDACADNVDDRIDRSNFVKVHLLGRQAVDLSLGDGDALEHGYRFLFHPSGQFALQDQLLNLTKSSAMVVRVGVSE